MEEKSKRVSLRVAMGTGLIAVLIYIIFLSIFKEKITAELTLSYFGTMLTAIVTIFGVMWQIEKNNEKMDSDNRTKELEKKLRVKKYIEHIIEQNLNIFLSKNVSAPDLKVFLEKIIHKRLQRDENLNGILTSFDSSYFTNNIDEILKFHYGKEILILNEEIESLKTTYLPKFLRFDSLAILNDITKIIVENKDLNVQERDILCFLNRYLNILVFGLYYDNKNKFYDEWYDETINCLINIEISDDELDLLKKDLEVIKDNWKKADTVLKKIDIYINSLEQFTNVKLYFSFFSEVGVIYPDKFEEIHNNIEKENDNIYDVLNKTKYVFSLLQSISYQLTKQQDS